MTAPVFGQAPVHSSKPEAEDLRLWSVTTLIGALDKPALTYWAANETAAAAVKHHKTWTEIARSSGRDEAERWLSGARFRTPQGERGAAELGTAVHAACEQFVLTGVKPDVDAELQPYIDNFAAWLDDFQPVYQGAEISVYSPERGYAGTCDGFLTIDGVRFIFDIKTSKKSRDKRGNPTPAYPEVALQLAAYRYAEIAAVWAPRRFEAFKRRYYLLGPTELAAAVAVPEVDHGLALKITPEAATAYPIECGREVHEAFLYIIEAARWQFERSKTVIGAPLVSPHHAEAVA